MQLAVSVPRPAPKGSRAACRRNWTPIEPSSWRSARRIRQHGDRARELSSGVSVQRDRRVFDGRRDLGDARRRRHDERGRRAVRAHDAARTPARRAGRRRLRARRARGGGGAERETTFGVSWSLADGITVNGSALVRAFSGRRAAGRRASAVGSPVTGGDSSARGCSIAGCRRATAAGGGGFLRRRPAGSAYGSRSGWDVVRPATGS